MEETSGNMPADAVGKYAYVYKESEKGRGQWRIIKTISGGMPNTVEFAYDGVTELSDEFDKFCIVNVGSFRRTIEYVVEAGVIGKTITLEITGQLAPNGSTKLHGFWIHALPRGSAGGLTTRRLSGATKAWVV
jgi:hypothetical protein